MGAELRDYKRSDFAAVKAIHDSTEIDYEFPDLNSPLFLITKVLTVDGIVRACGGMYLQLECYLWLDRSDWAGPEEKLSALKAMDTAAMGEAWLRGLDQAVLWLPPGMERFGERLVEDLGFTRDREGWVSFSKRTK